VPTVALGIDAAVGIAADAVTSPGPAVGQPPGCAEGAAGPRVAVGTDHPMPTGWLCRRPLAAA
jgi:hypothetical protein